MRLAFRFDDVCPVQWTVKSRLGRGQLVTVMVTLTVNLLTSHHSAVSLVST